VSNSGKENKDGGEIGADKEKSSKEEGHEEKEVRPHR